MMLVFRLHVAPPTAWLASYLMATHAQIHAASRVADRRALSGLPPAVAAAGVAAPRGAARTLRRPRRGHVGMESVPSMYTTSTRQTAAATTAAAAPGPSSAASGVAPPPGRPRAAPPASHPPVCLPARLPSLLHLASQRKRTLLVEYKQLRKANSFVDRRFGGGTQRPGAAATASALSAPPAALPSEGEARRRVSGERRVAGCGGRGEGGGGATEGPVVRSEHIWFPAHLARPMALAILGGAEP
eukprot:356275-Chlamydomonas_euryale.AAC.2